MKKKYFITIILIVTCLFLGSTASAVGLEDAFSSETLDSVASTSGYDLSESSTTRSIESIISSIISLVLALLGLIFILIIFLAADLWMKANGNPDKVLKAKKMISQALIGLSFVLIAYALSWILSLIFATTGEAGMGLFN